MTALPVLQFPRAPARQIDTFAKACRSPEPPNPSPTLSPSVHAFASSKMKAQQLLVLALAGLALGTHAEDYLGGQCVGEECDNGLPCLTLTGDACPLREWPYEDAQVPHPCTCGGAGGESDPYFTGFYGQSFYFPAEADKTYNILSEQSHLVNAHFVATDLPEESDLVARLSGARNSSFIGSVALRHDYSLVEVSADRVGNLAISINGEPLPLGEDRTDLTLEMLLGVGVELIVRKTQLPYMNEVMLETELLSIRIQPEMQHTDNLGNSVRGHLSLQLSLKGSNWGARAAHGVLGQTADPAVASNVTDAFPGEGSAEDYEVSSLGAHDFAYNLYSQQADLDPRRLADIQRISTQQKPQPIASSRRLLASRQEEPQTLSARVRSDWAAYPRSS